MKFVSKVNLLKADLAKCDFAKVKVTYLGKVSGQGCVETIDGLPSPTAKKELMRFLGVSGYYRVL